MMMRAVMAVFWRIVDGATRDDRRLRISLLLGVAYLSAYTVHRLMT